MLTETSFVLKLSETMATGADSTGIGGERASGDVVLTDSNAVFYAMSADGPGGSDRVQYAKIFDFNSDATEDATNYGLYLANALPNLGSAAVFSFEGDPADEGKTIKVIAFTSGGDPITETDDLDEGGAATCSTPMKGPVRVFASDALEGELVIKHGGVTKGVIPPGGRSATSELDIGLEAVLDGSQTIATPSTAPSGVTFSRPATSGDRLLVDGGGGTLPAQGAQGIWLRWTVVPEMLGSEPVQAYVLGYLP